MLKKAALGIAVEIFLRAKRTKILQRKARPAGERPNKKR